MNQIKRWIALVTYTIAPTAANAECSLHSIEPVAGTVQASGRTIQLGDADDAIRPAAWQGPLVADTCRLDLGIIEGPLMMTNARMLYVPTYSGSVRRLFLVDLQACEGTLAERCVFGEIENRSTRAFARRPAHCR